MKMLKAYKGDKLLVEEVENANHFVRRFMGLMYRKSMAENHGLLLTPCDEIHTFGMRFAIDTVALDKDNRVLFIDPSVPPHKVRKRVKNCKKILELNAGTAENLGIAVGDVLAFK
ncbi:MAG: DUF192 domain-containing protein [Clostridia bacterium]|nr:DUF192 domain-containing protein [Clostridia bacterium]